jgi:hypothetical protein
MEGCAPGEDGEESQCGTFSLGLRGLPDRGEAKHGGRGAGVVEPDY